MNRAQRAQQLWSILVIAAQNRQVLTYEIVGKACGVPAASIGDFLRPIQQYCSENGLPPITSLVVGKESGSPGEGFIAAKDVPGSQAQTFSWDWLAGPAPSEEELAAAYERAPDRR
jgi:putative restriction endonuclease